MENYARDLLKGFNMSAGVDVRGVDVSMREENDERVELNLGLSLGGRFGVNKDAKKKKLLRSSSVLGTMPLLRDRAAVAPSLMRTASLPAEGEEELRRRKEMQTQRRMEARRRRSEKQRGGSGAGGDEAVVAGSVAIGGLNRFGSSAAVTVAVPPPGWRALAVTKQAVLGRGRGFQGLFGKPSAQGLGDSPGGSSSSLSAEMDSKAILGSIPRGEAKSPVVNQSAQVRSSHNAAGSGGKTNEIVAARTPKAEVENPSRPIGTNSMDHNMPCVFTTGNGPNGRRIEGVLYKYGNGEEVRIMCVCHGTFMSPAEFVKHAGGGDVEYPLRHIVVSAATNPFL